MSRMKIAVPWLDYAKRMPCGSTFARCHVLPKASVRTLV
jgi:hypothetical protein